MGDDTGKKPDGLAKYVLHSQDSRSVVISFRSEITDVKEIPDFIQFLEGVVDAVLKTGGGTRTFVLDARSLLHYHPVVGLRITQALKSSGLVKRVNNVFGRCICIMGNRTTAIPGKFFAKMFNGLFGGGRIQILCCSIPGDRNSVRDLEILYKLPSQKTTQF